MHYSFSSTEMSSFILLILLERWFTLYTFLFPNFPVCSNRPNCCNLGSSLETVFTDTSDNRANSSAEYSALRVVAKNWMSRAVAFPLNKCSKTPSFELDCITLAAIEAMFRVPRISFPVSKDHASILWPHFCAFLLTTDLNITLSPGVRVKNYDSTICQIACW